MEIWKPIPGFSLYEASNFGNLRSLNYKRTNKVKMLKPSICDGYYKTMLKNDNGKYKTVRVHRLITLSFLGSPSKDQPEVNHKDGNKENNKIDNLEYCSRSENIIHAINTGLQKIKRGSEIGNSKLNEDQVLEIRDYVKEHGKLKNRKELALHYGVSESTLKDIASGRRGSWNHV